VKLPTRLRRPIPQEPAESKNIMANAVIRSGGKQYRVAEGEVVVMDKLVGKPGDKVEFREVLSVGGDAPKLGKPLVSGVAVSGEIVGERLGDKLVVFKFRRRKKYRRKTGHRQQYTAVKITGITG
jgi:large subunit ribosomal protein L21